MKYYISLYSKHTGDRIVLGSKYETQEAAVKYAENNVCTTCNGYEVSCTQDHYEWMDKHHGFVDPASIRSLREKDRLKREAASRAESMFYRREAA